MKKLYVLYNGKYVEIPEKKKGIINGADIDFGDVITVSLTAGNLIKSYTKRYYPDGIPSEVTDKSVSPAEPYGCVGGTNDELALIYGVVLTMKDGIITIGPEDGSAYEPVVVNTNAPELKIYRLDSDDETVEISGADDIFDGASAGIENASKVLVRITCRMEYELIIFD